MIWKISTKMVSQMMGKRELAIVNFNLLKIIPMRELGTDSYRIVVVKVIGRFLVNP